MKTSFFKLYPHRALKFAESAFCPPPLRRGIKGGGWILNADSAFFARIVETVLDCHIERSEISQK
ncbi:hypothetical protein ACWIUD_10935 [Helicobacter sp. 23-1044]